MKNEKLTSDVLAARLWAMANALRGNIDCSEFKDYTLGLLFYKFLSDKCVSITMDTWKDFGLTYEELYKEANIEKNLIEELGTAVPPKYTFDKMVERIVNREFDSTKYLQEAFDAILTIAKKNPKSANAYRGLLSSVDLNSPRLGNDDRTRASIIANILLEINKIYSDYEGNGFDILGTAYEILIGDFAASAGKKGGEFYTPECMQKLVCELASDGLTEIDNACDPTCGSASMLIKLGETKKVKHYYGTELNSVTEQLARMNMILHSVDFETFTIRQGNTLSSPDLAGDEVYDVVVANPPYSAHWDNSSAMEDIRFLSYGKPAPTTKADLAFVQHIVYHLKNYGRAAVLLPHGVLFRGSAEKQIRETLLKDNVIDAIIGLPSNCFYGTGIPVCCLVINKGRKSDDPIAIIDASKYFSKNKDMNYITNEDINRILDAYRGKKDIDRFCHMATMNEIKENDFNLNIPRYVDSSDPIPEIDLKKVAEDIKNVQKEIFEVDNTLKSYFNELGLKYPFDNHFVSTTEGKEISREVA